MRNRNNFVPKTFKYQPTRYRQIGINWNAVFETSNGKMFYLEIDGEWTNPERGRGVSVLMQGETCRLPLGEPHNTIKAGLFQLERLLDKYSA